MEIGKLFKAIFTGKPVKDHVESNPHFDTIIDNALKEIGRDNYWFSLKTSGLKTFTEQALTLTNNEKIDFIVYEVKKVDEYYKSKQIYSSDDVGYHKASIGRAFFGDLLKGKIEFDDAGFIKIINTAIAYNSENGYPIKLPLKNILNKVQKAYTGIEVPAGLQMELKALQKKLEHSKSKYFEKENSKLIEQIEEILFPNKALAAGMPVLFPGKDDFSTYADSQIELLPLTERIIWYQLIAQSKKTNGAKPTKRYLEDGYAIIQTLGIARFKETVTKLLLYLINQKERQIRTPTAIGGREYILLSYEFVSALNTECIKGLLWLCSTFKDKELLNLIASLADRAYKKIAGHGQTSTGIGNACVYVLYKTEGLEGIGHLSRLKVRIKLPSTQQLIEKYLIEAAKERSIPVTEFEDLAVDDFGLKNGQRTFDIADYKVVLQIEKVGSVRINWLKNDGSSQKSDPAIIKEKHATGLKEIKLFAKQIEATLSAQRDRLDSSFKQGRKLTEGHFNKYYLNHGLVSFFCRRLIWRVRQSDKMSNVFWFEDRWIDCQQQDVELKNVQEISLWHPVNSSIEEVSAWRSFFIKNQIQQPIKQAFREIYLLTDAEITTRTYSNRMAGHILKQYQFNSLTKARNWQYTIQGGFDNGADGTAQIRLPEFNLIAEYWTNAVDAADALNASGIFNYVATDQVRFMNTQTRQVMELIDVPVEVFSEVMRDVDLFVGVSSVGNDPTWRDSGGLPAYRDYWQSYSFGELTELAKSRKEILERLIPRLKIAKTATISDKFLIVKGRKRTYKIHLGSTNILMEPNDQYLCIVPDKSQKNVSENVFLPFEGDTGLSIILSKALLLSEDDKITDPVITNQINRN